MSFMLFIWSVCLPMLLQLSGSHVLRETWDRLEDLTRDVDG